MIAAPQKGDRIGQYRVDDLVRAAAWRPFFVNSKPLRDPYAIKIPHFEFESDPLFFDRFHREIDIGRKFTSRGGEGAAQRS